MKRRDLLLLSGTAFLGLATTPFILSQEKKKQKILYFSRSAGHVHPPVNRAGQALSMSEKLLMQWGEEVGLEVVCTQDGAIFDEDLSRFDAFVFYTSGDLCGKHATPQPGSPMSIEGKKKFLAAIESGKGFVGIHAATDTFRSSGIDPYIAMLGAEFVTHGQQQKATLTVVDPKFPGIAGLGKSLMVHDEWYVQSKFAEDMHVILTLQTQQMKGDCYHRPPYPAMWARMHGKGRVFYTALGHNEIWHNKIFKQTLLGGLNWTLGNVDADVSPNYRKLFPKV